MGNVILGLLLLAPQTLYELKKQFEAGVSLFYSASAGSIRTALLGLLDRGLVTVTEHVENGRNKKTYAITDAGRAEFERWMSEPITGGNVEVAALSRVFFLGLLPDPAARAAILDGIVERTEADLAGLEAYAARLDAAEIPEHWREAFTHQRATLDYGIVQHRTALEWFRRHRDATR